jgi:hypothetical protein
MISKPTITRAWRAVAKSGDEFVAAINCQSLRANWSYAFTVTYQRGVLVVTRYGKPLGVVGSVVVLRDILTEWRDRQANSRHAEVRRALEEIIAGVRSTQFPFNVVELGVKQRPSGIVQFFEDLSTQDKFGLILWHKRVYVYLIPLGWLASYKAECARDEPEVRKWLEQILNWAWTHEVVIK